MRGRLANDEIEAQMAIVESTMVPLDPVLLPEVIMPNGRTFVERVRNGIVKLTGERYNTFRACGSLVQF